MTAAVRPFIRGRSIIVSVPGVGLVASSPLTTGGVKLVYVASGSVVPSVLSPRV